jgi:N-acetylglucosaminyldiphosphoundecaprenol N-acetyl-beta-D-mannosaminyltransferase
MGTATHFFFSKGPIFTKGRGKWVAVPIFTVEHPMPDATPQPAPRGCLPATTLLAGVLIFLARLKRGLPVATDRVPMLGIPVDPLTMPDAIARAEGFIASRRPHHIVTADASGIMQAQDDPALLRMMQQAALVTPDGAGVLLAARLRGVQLPARVSGVDLVEQLSALAAQKGYLVYLFGAAEGVADEAAEKLKARHPGLTIVGTRNGFFADADAPAIAREIANTHPDILFVALGIPKQEQFIRGHFTELGVPVMIGVGGSFDVIAGRLQRAPAWMQRTGLEWLFRIAQQPKRLPRLAALPRFIVAAWREKTR